MLMAALQAAQGGHCTPSAAEELEAGFSPNSQHFLSSSEVVQVETAAEFSLGQHRARPA